VAVLAVLMDPPVQMEKRQQEDPCWVLLDEEGEEVKQGLAENDLVALLNQVKIIKFSHLNVGCDLKYYKYLMIFSH